MQRAPAIAGYSWGQHPNALFLVYPSKDCGCGGSPLERVQQGLKHGLDVLVIAPAPSENFDVLMRSSFPPSRFALVTDVGPDIIKRFSPADKPSAARIRNGRIVAQSAGGELSESFLKKEVK